MPTDRPSMSPGPGDQRLELCFRRGIEGEVAAYREFLGSVTEILQAFFRKRLRDRAHDIDDLVQEVVLAVHLRRHTFSAAVPITAWIHAIARHKFMDLLRADSSRARLFEPLEDADAAGQDAIASWQAHWDLRRLLEGLPEKQRVAIECIKLFGYSVVETSRMTGMSEASVKVSVHRGIKTLSARLRGGHGGFEAA